MARHRRIANLEIQERVLFGDDNDDDAGGRRHLPLLDDVTVFELYITADNAHPLHIYVATRESATYAFSDKHNKISIINVDGRAQSFQYVLDGGSRGHYMAFAFKPADWSNVKLELVYTTFKDFAAAACGVVAGDHEQLGGDAESKCDLHWPPEANCQRRHSAVLWTNDDDDGRIKETLRPDGIIELEDSAGHKIELKHEAAAAGDWKMCTVHIVGDLDDTWRIGRPVCISAPHRIAFPGSWISAKKRKTSDDARVDPPSPLPLSTDAAASVNNK